MLESRKIVSVKTFCDENDVNHLFVRAFVNPSFGRNPRPAVLLFEQSRPVVALAQLDHCNMQPYLGIDAILKNYDKTGETLLEQTYTQVWQFSSHDSKQNFGEMASSWAIKLSKIGETLIHKKIDFDT